MLYLGGYYVVVVVFSGRSVRKIATLTTILRVSYSVPFKASRADLASSSLSNETKPKPREQPTNAKNELANVKDFQKYSGSGFLIKN